MKEMQSVLLFIPFKCRLLTDRFESITNKILNELNLIII